MAELFQITSTHRRSYAIPKYIDILKWEIRGKLQISINVFQVLTQCLQ